MDVILFPIDDPSFRVSVPYKAAIASLKIVEMIGERGEGSFEVPIINADSKLVQLLADFLNLHAEHGAVVIPKPLPHAGLQSYVAKPYFEFIEGIDSGGDTSYMLKLYALINLGDRMDLLPLQELASAKLAALMIPLDERECEQKLCRGIRYDDADMLERQKKFAFIYNIPKVEWSGNQS